MPGPEVVKEKLPLVVLGVLAMERVVGVLVLGRHRPEAVVGPARILELAEQPQVQIQQAMQEPVAVLALGLEAQQQEAEKLEVLALLVHLAVIHITVLEVEDQEQE